MFNAGRLEFIFVDTGHLNVLYSLHLVLSSRAGMDRV